MSECRNHCTVHPSTEQLGRNALTLTSVAVHGDNLVAVVQYSGGCGEHTLHLEANGPMLKSLPPSNRFGWCIVLLETPAAP